MFSDQVLLDTSRFLEVGKAEIMTVAEVESCGAGFLEDGQPKILYEPFQFGRLTNHIYDGTTTSINGNIYPISLNGKWSAFRAKYGKQSIQHLKLQSAIRYNRDAALSACSWGKFQIMGYHWENLGYPSLQDFINAMYRSEDEHLIAFSRYLKCNNLVSALKNHRWKQFKEGYNGTGTNDYVNKLEKAFIKYSNRN